MSAVDLGDADIVLVRHGETTYNALGLLNGDPAVPVPLTRDGDRRVPRAAPAARADRVGGVRRLAVRAHRCRASRRWCRAPSACPIPTSATSHSASSSRSRATPTARGARSHGIGEAPDGGESRLDVLARYARGLRRLATATAHPVLVVTHDQPIRYLLNALHGDDPILGPAPPVANASPYPFTAAALADGAERLAATLR